MSLVFERAIACAQEIERRFRETGTLEVSKVDESLGLYDLSFSWTLGFSFFNFSSLSTF